MDMQEAQKRRLALFLDGTWNTLNDNTNVWRLKSLCPQSADQKVYYSVGVGTKKGEKISGGAFGIGIDEEVMAAYEWIVETYAPDDRLFIFGFSRGAFTARSLAGFISKCGLLQPGSPLSMNQLYARYRKGDVPSVRALQDRQDGLTLEDRWIKKYSRPIPIWFQGVWDTVGTLGVPLPFFPRVSRSKFKFLETDLRINDTHAFHALAIDEHRASFKPTLWQKTTPRTGPTYPPRDFAHVEQRWFAGAHSNVGGGYENDLLAQVPLRWMAGKAAAHGLAFTGLTDLDEDPDGCAIRDSFGEMMSGCYRLARLGVPFHRTIGADPELAPNGATNNINESIDASVFRRWQNVATYRPVNLGEWAQRHSVRPEEIATSVNAAKPSESIPG